MTARRSRIQKASAAPLPDTDPGAAPGKIEGIAFDPAFRCLPDKEWQIIVNLLNAAVSSPGGGIEAARLFTPLYDKIMLGVNGPTPP